jgi:hypothetical protein
MYYVDRSLATMSILPSNGSEQPKMEIPIALIQIICPVTDIMRLLDQLDASLQDSEIERGVLVEYYADKEKSSRLRVCFLEETPSMRDRFVQALTSLWLEKRNDHSMWF